MKLYGHPQSSCTRKVLMTLAETGQDAELVRIELVQGDHTRPAHLARHPYGKVPVLEDAGLLLYESSAIARYLVARSSEQRLVPSDLRERARLDQWLSVEPAYLGPAVWRLMSQLVLGPMYGLAPDLAEVEEARREVGHTLEVLERALVGRSYLVGAQFTLAEVAFMPALQALAELRQGDLIRKRERVLAWWEQIRARPTWSSVLSLAHEERMNEPAQGVRTRPSSVGTSGAPSA
jgi:glutathione S-transferase